MYTRRKESDFLTELEKRGYVGHPGQLYTLRRVTVAEGKTRGAAILEVCTAGGLQLDILPDSGLDIGMVHYGGKTMSWMSKNGYDSPAVFSSQEDSFSRTFPGGLLYTCGLRSAGPANWDGEEWHPLHGRYHGLPAEQVCAEVVGEEIVVRGVVRQTALFGHALELRRTIRIPVFGSELTVEDAVTNLTPEEQEFMQVYHCNFGYPLLDEHARLLLPEERCTTPRTDFARTGLDRTCTFEPPVVGEEERVFFQEPKGEFWAKLCNPAIGVQMTLRWSGETLPILAEWRSMAHGDYVLGLEPANCYIMGRSAERGNGTLPVLPAFGTRYHKIQIAFQEDRQ